MRRFGWTTHPCNPDSLHGLVQDGCEAGRHGLVLGQLVGLCVADEGVHVLHQLDGGQRGAGKVELLNALQGLWSTERVSGWRYLTKASTNCTSLMAASAAPGRLKSSMRSRACPEGEGGELGHFVRVEHRV